MNEAPASPRRLPSSRGGWQALLNDLGVRPSKGLGQNFLVERGVVQKMVETLKPAHGERVLEIGPGLGILTEELLASGAPVTAIELDRRLVGHLRAIFGDDPRFTLIEGNALAIDPADTLPGDEPYLVAANLPYSIAAAVIRHLLESRRRPARLAVMVQREVAERMTAAAPAMSILAVGVQYFAEASIAFLVPASVFIPPPNVESAVVLLHAHPRLPLATDEQRRLFRIVNAGFRQKRKQLANSIADETGSPKPAVTDWLTSAGIDPARRAQTLSVEEWITLTRAAPPDIPL